MNRQTVIGMRSVPTIPLSTQFKRSLPTTIQSRFMHIARELGYKVHEKGVCRGFSLMWAQAVCSRDLETFNDRLTLLMNLEDKDISLLEENIRKAWDKAKSTGFDGLSAQEKQHYELRAFFEGLALYQNPTIGADIFKEKLAALGVEGRFNQRDAPHFAEYFTPDVLAERGGLVRGLAVTDQYNHASLCAYLTKISAELKEKPDVAIVFGSHNHAVSARILSNGDFELNDINNTELTKHKPQLSPEELAVALEQASELDPHAPFLMTTEIYTSGEDALSEKTVAALSPTEKITTLTRDQTGTTLLHEAAIGRDFVNLDRFDFKKIDLNARNKKGYTALSMAIAAGNQDLARRLIENGANCNIRLVKTDTLPLMLACEMGQHKIIRLLLERTQFTRDDLRPKSDFNRTIPLLSPDLQQICLKKALESYIQDRSDRKEHLNVLGLGYSKTEKVAAAQALLDKMAGKEVDLKPHHRVLNQGRLKRLYQHHHTTTEIMQQYEQGRQQDKSTEPPKINPDAGENEHM